jgi:outer membrane protein OmpA-like peptidoglycan-associated protein
VGTFFRRMRLARPGAAALMVGALLLTQGCAWLNSRSGTAKGAGAGAAAGAVVGGLIGRANGSTAKGAILGAVIGGAAGAAIGHEMDKEAKDLQDKLPDAKVERVGEGIEVTFNSGILFDVNSDALRPTAEHDLQELATSLQDYEGTSVLVVGHTDSTGTATYNQALSERRANSARVALLQDGLAPDRVEAAGRGESEPVASNETAAGRQENRRVEVAIYASEQMRKEMLKKHGG